MDINTLRNKYYTIKGKKESLESQLNSKLNEVQSIQFDLKESNEALEIIQKVALQTQQLFKYNLETPVTSALQQILPEPYNFKVNFDIKRGKTEASLSLERNGAHISPNGSTGGTVLDITSLVLRIVLWNLESPRKAPCFFLDEFEKHISAEYRGAVAEFVKQLSETMGIQFIIVTHDRKNYLDCADKVISVTMKDGVSKA